MIDTLTCHAPPPPPGSELDDPRLIAVVMIDCTTPPPRRKSPRYGLHLLWIGRDAFRTLACTAEWREAAPSREAQPRMLANYIATTLSQGEMPVRDAMGCLKAAAVLLDLYGEWPRLDDAAGLLLRIEDGPRPDSNIQHQLQLHLLDRPTVEHYHARVTRSGRPPRDLISEMQAKRH